MHGNCASVHPHIVKVTSPAAQKRASRYRLLHRAKRAAKARMTVAQKSGQVHTRWVKRCHIIGAPLIDRSSITPANKPVHMAAAMACARKSSRSFGSSASYAAYVAER